MPSSVTTNIPSTWTSGEYITWSDVLPDYTAGVDSAAAKYEFVGGITPETHTITGTGSGTTWTFLAPTATNLLGGIYSWQLIGTKTPSATAQSTVLAVGYAALTITPNFTTAWVAPSQAILDAINTAITSLAAQTIQSANINGEAYTYADLNKLYQMQVSYQAAVIRETSARNALLGLAKDQSVEVIFGPVGGFTPFATSCPYTR